MEVFVKLVHKGTRTPLNDNEPALITVAAGASKVGHLKEAVHRRCYRAVGHVDADALRVCDPDGLEGAYVATHAPLSAIDPAKIYFVEVPTVSEAKIGVAPPPVIWTAQLVHRGTRSPFNKIGPVAILAPPGYKTVGHLLATVHQQCHHTVGHVDVCQLKMAAPDDLEGEYLDVFEPIEPTKVYVVEVPSVSQSAAAAVRPSVEWSAPQARPHLVIRNDVKIVELAEVFTEGTGVGSGRRLLKLFCRRQFVDQWNVMKWNSVDNEALQWIVGPPGTGKSCTALAFAYALNSSVWDVLWIGFSPPDDAFLCVWLHEEEKMMCRVAVQDVQLLQQLVDSLSSTRSTLVFLDGYAASAHELEEARRICKKWHCLDKALRRLIYVCSMSSVNKKYRTELYPAISRRTPDVQMETEGTESSVVQLISNPPSSAPAERLLTEMSYDLESWRLEDYQEAIMDNDEFFESVKDMFDPFPSEMDGPMEGRAKLLEEKFCIAGGSVRLMFAVSVNTAMTSLDKAIRELASKSQRLLDVSARGAINRLRAEYHHGANRQETCFVSEYVARKFAALHGPELLQQVVTLCDVDTAMDGYLFEAWFFASLKAWGVKWCYLRKFINKDGEFARAETTFFDPKHESIAVSLENAIWLAPVKWNQGGYDAVFIDKAECIVRFIRVTRAQNHKFYPDYFIKLLVKLAMHADMVGVQLKAVVLYFVVPMERLKTFTCPVSSQDFGTSVIQHTSVAGSIAKATRSHSYGMFRKSKSKVKVIGVNYAKVKRARQMNG